MFKRPLPMAKEPVPFRDSLDALAAPAVLAEKEGDSLRCHACAHHCKLKPGQHGLCGVRFNKGGQMFAPRNYVARTYTRPVETTTVFHVRPGTEALAFGMFGCDLRCGYCHNWYISQALREDASGEEARAMTAKQLVEKAVSDGAKVVCAAFNEPLISAEWVKEIFTAAKRKGLTTLITTDGNSTPEVLEFIRPVTDAIRVDLKAYDDEGYRKLGGRFDPVIQTIKRIHKAGIWLEVVTLVTQDLNTDVKGLTSIADFLADLDPTVPWHLNAAQRRYKHDKDAVSSHFLDTIADKARTAGLRYVYTGNLQPGVAQDTTRCSKCSTVLIKRRSFSLAASSMNLNTGECPKCGHKASGLWSHAHVERLRKKVQRRNRKRVEA